MVLFDDMDFVPSPRDSIIADGRQVGKMTSADRGYYLEAGLILLSCGLRGETIGILVPLTIADGTLEEGLDKLE